jgi:hypothetical protein
MREKPERKSWSLAAPEKWRTDSYFRNGSAISRYLNNLPSYPNKLMRSRGRKWTTSKTEWMSPQCDHKKVNEGDRHEVGKRAKHSWLCWSWRPGSTRGTRKEANSVAATSLSNRSRRHLTQLSINLPHHKTVMKFHRHINTNGISWDYSH